MGTIFKSGSTYPGGGGTGGGGTDNYADLTNKPSINGTTLIGSKTASITNSGTTTVNSMTNAGTLPSFSYDAQTKALTFNAGTLPTKGNDTTVLTSAGQITLT